MKTKPKTRHFVAVMVGLFGLLALASISFAHHGNAGYDMTKKTTLKASVTDFRWSNPHTIALFDVKDDQGNIQKWTGELGPPNNLHRWGWTSRTIKPGDEVTIVGNVCKDGGNCIFVLTVKLPDGKTMQGTAPGGAPGNENP